MSQHHKHCQQHFILIHPASFENRGSILITAHIDYSNVCQMAYTWIFDTGVCNSANAVSN